jgi:hypothetical protein
MLSSAIAALKFSVEFAKLASLTMSIFLLYKAMLLNIGLVNILDDELTKNHRAEDKEKTSAKIPANRGS